MQKGKRKYIDSHSKSSKVITHKEREKEGEKRSSSVQ